jgi:hypothetical protein
MVLSVTFSCFRTVQTHLCIYFTVKDKVFCLLRCGCKRRLFIQTNCVVIFQTLNPKSNEQTEIIGNNHYKVTQINKWYRLKP